MSGRVVSGEVESAAVRDVGFTSESGKALARKKAEDAKLLREARRQAVEEFLGGKMNAALKLLVAQVDAAESEQRVCDEWNRTVEDATLDGLERRSPDKDVMARGLRAAELIIERVAGKVSTKLEGEVTHLHVFSAVEDAIKQRRGW